MAAQEKLPALLNAKGRRFFPLDSEDESAGDGRPRVLVIDNYDSFTFNLVQYLIEEGAVVDVYRNDEVEAAEVLNPSTLPTHILLSPGPGRPEDSGVCQELCRQLVSGEIVLPMLGVCLGHQTLCEVFGATVNKAERIMHGKVSPIVHEQSGVFAGIPSPYSATRYHSLIVDEPTLPSFLLPTARTPEKELMAVSHESRPVHGVQFHPESILSDYGHQLIRNFLNMGGAGDRE